MVLAVLVPIDVITANHQSSPVLTNDEHDIITLKALCQSLLTGLLVMDFILGTSHLLSHHRLFKKWLWQYHARHHTKHYNSFSVKYHGHSFDLEVFLTQACNAFLPRLLGLDVVTGAALMNIFSLQLLMEHSGYKCFYVAKLHEAHHRYGNVGFYHYPIWEYLFGNLPSANQLRDLSDEPKRVVAAQPQPEKESRGGIIGSVRPLRRQCGARAA